tara:strand:- start:46 stop:366 length:321 start_codon:yes stop_codon:yes gene_type:complete
MSGGVFDWQQFSIQEIVSIMSELIDEYEDVSSVDEKMNISDSRVYIDDLNDEIIEEMKTLRERLKRDFLWVDALDKYFSGDLSKDSYFKQLEIIKFENVDDYSWEE